MKFIKQLMLSFLLIFLVTILVFILHLFLNSNQGKSILSTSLFVIFTVFIYGIFHLFTGKLKLAFLQGRTGAIIIVFIAMILAINITVISISNTIIFKIYNEQVTVSQKLNHYKNSIEALFSKKVYTKIANSKLEKANTDKLDYINFCYDDKVDKYYIELVKECVPQVEKATNIIFGEIDKQNLNIIFYSNVREFEKNAMGLNYLSGLYDGVNSIHLNRFSKEQAKWEIEQIFMHEYAHYIYDLYLYQHRITNDIPQWFAEGIAEYVGYNGSIVEYSPSWMQETEKLTRMGTNEDFQRLLENKNYNPYLQSYYAVNTLINMKGINIITDILQESKEKEFYEAFLEMVGIDIETFQDNYLKDYIDEYNRRT